MASVFTLAEDVPSNVAYVSEAFWVEAGVGFTCQSLFSGTGSNAPNLYMYGSLDGEIWTNLYGLNVDDFTTIPALNQPSVNYWRLSHDGGGSSTRLLTVKMVQPNFKKVDVTSLPA